jgi:Holliday junction resolvase RusA-like endonuclease
MAQQVSEKPHFPKAARLAVTIHFYGYYRSGDTDNRIKAVSDSANGILWYDDSQIDELHAYREGGEEGDDEYRTTVFVREVTKDGNSRYASIR